MASIRFSSLLFILHFLLMSCAASSIAPVMGSNLRPVIRTNFMDPCLTQVDGVWYAFGGANGNPPHINVQLASSADFSNWTLHTGYDALPNLGSWANRTGHVWSPDVNQRADGTFVMYYSAITTKHPRRHCIGAAISATIAGPYTPLDNTIACDLAAGGAIDPDMFYDPQDGAYYLLYKIDGNSIGSGGACSNSNNPKTPTPIAMQMLSSNQTSPIGPPVYLISNVVSAIYSSAVVDYAAGPDVEGPSMFFRNGTYYLAYNSGCFAEEDYQVNYLVCEGAPAVYACGRWSDGQSEESVLLTTGSSPSLYAPGSVDAVVGENATMIVFHGDLNVGWFANHSETRVRGMFAAELTYQNRTVLQVTSSGVPGLSDISLLYVSYRVMWMLVVMVYLAIS